MDIFTNTVKAKYDLGDETTDSWFKAFVWSFICAFVITVICSRSSFLYVFNLWDEANSSFTMGKCIFRGMVPYKDLFGRDGILLYFIYGLASLISPVTFRGVFVMEVIAATFTIFWIMRIYQLFLEPTTFPYIVTPVTAAVLYSSGNFYWGGSAEEFILPFIACGLYMSVHYFRRIYPKPMNFGTVLAGGILAGCVLNIKYNSLGFFFAFIIMVLLGDLIGSRSVLKALVSFFVFLGGMVLATLPWLICFAVNGAAGEWLNLYFYKNIFEYSSKLTGAEKTAGIYDILKNHFLNNSLLYGLMVFGCLYLLVSAISTYVYEDPNKRLKRSRFFVNISFMELLNIGAELFFLLFMIFIGGVGLPSYSLPTNVFVLFGFMPFCYIIEKLLKGKIERHTHGRDYGGSILDTPTAFITSIVSLILGVVLTFFVSINPKVMNITADELWLYKFQDYIADSGVENPGIINELCLDAGLYTVLNEEPICYHYQTQSLNMQEALDMQKTYLHSGEADFVLSRDVPAEGIGDRYDLVMKERCVFHEFDHVYYLYQRNETPVDEG